MALVVYCVCDTREATSKAILYICCSDGSPSTALLKTIDSGFFLVFFFQIYLEKLLLFTIRQLLNYKSHDTCLLHDNSIVGKIVVKKGRYVFLTQRRTKNNDICLFYSKAWNAFTKAICPFAFPLSSPSSSSSSSSSSSIP